MDHGVGVLVLLLESIVVEHNLLLRMEGLWSIRILLLISLFASSVLRPANVLVQLTKFISKPRLLCSW